jgi:hypothetical protein
VAHTNLSKVTRVVFVHQCSVVMLATGVTPSSRMLAVLSNTTVPSRDMTTLLSVFTQVGRHV